MRIGHFTPGYGGVCDEQGEQLLRESITMGQLGYEWRHWKEYSTDIVSVRNRNLQRAIDKGLDYVLFQDADIYSNSKIGAAAVLLETARKTGAAAVAALVGLRSEPPKANVWPLPEQPGAVYEAEKAGTGIMLIDCRQIASWDYSGPWFDNVYADERKTRIETGEDIYFCNLIREMGATLYVDSRLPTTHVKRDTRTLDYPGLTRTAEANAGTTKDVAFSTETAA